MAISETEICNMALGRLGSLSIENIETDTGNEGIKCRLFYSVTRDSLLRSHAWRFAIGRKALSADTVAPAFGYDHQYILPSDCLRVIGLYDSDSGYAVEGDRLLIDDDAAYIFYVRKIDDPAKFDPMFVNVLVVALAVELCMPLTKDKTLRDRLEAELARTLSNARLINLTETNTQAAAQSWNEARI